LTIYQWFADLIGAPATGANDIVVLCCAVTCVLLVCVACKACFKAIDYMIGGRKK